MIKHNLTDFFGQRVLKPKAKSKTVVYVKEAVFLQMYIKLAYRQDGVIDKLLQLHACKGENRQT